MALLGKADILAHSETETLTIDVPEWGGELRIALLSGSDMDAYENTLINKKGRVDIKNARAKFLALVIVDEDGKRVFTQGDVTALGRKSTKAIARVYKIAQEFCALDEDEIETLVKN